MPRRNLIVGWAAMAIAVVLGPAPAAWAGGGGCGEVTTGEGATVELLGLCITPTLLRVDPGATVTFVNRDPFRHIITGAGVGWGSPGFLRGDASFTATFRRPGVYPFQCYLHPGMAGAVLVGDANGPGAAAEGRVQVAPAPSPVVLTETRGRPVFVTEPVERVGWLALGAGLVLSVAGGAALLGARRRAVRGAPIEPVERTAVLR